MKVSVVIQTASFDVTRETILLGEGCSSIGAIVTFIGLVRDVNEGMDVVGLHLEHYPGMAEKQIQKIVNKAGGRWRINSVRVLHRVGELKPTDPIVFVGVASQHRSDAFQACEFIMDHLKVRAPFWKKERISGCNPDDESWLETKASDQARLKRWE